jgi:hypothetical protein
MVRYCCGPGPSFNVCGFPSTPILTGSDVVYCLISCLDFLSQLFARINNKVVTDPDSHRLLVYIYPSVVLGRTRGHVSSTYVELVSVDICRLLNYFLTGT